MRKILTNKAFLESILAQGMITYLNEITITEYSRMKLKQSKIWMKNQTLLPFFSLRLNMRVLLNMNE